MATVAPITTPRKATHSAHRTAFGPGKQRTVAQRALHVAQSIALRNDAGDAWTWDTYGLESNDAQQALVIAALLQMALDAREDARAWAWYVDEEMARLEDWERLEELEAHGRW